MEDAIYEYIPLSIEEKKNIWKNGTFVFDTNVLLSLYVIGEKEREDLIKVIKKLNDVWIPYQVAVEFMKNKNNKIDSYKSSYCTDPKKKIKDHIKDIKKEFGKLKKYKTINIDESDFSSQCDKLDEWYKELEKIPVISINEDNEKEILNNVFKIFNGKTGSGFSEEELIELQKKGKKRYSSKIPPGYCDINKTNDHPYGDYFLWEEILNYSKNIKRKIIFITSDEKKDWWLKENGKTIGPRLELIKEFAERTELKKSFYMYNLKQFMDVYNVMNPENKHEIAKETLDKVDKITNLEDENARQFPFLNPFYLGVEDSIGTSETWKAAVAFSDKMRNNGLALEYFPKRDEILSNEIIEYMKAMELRLKDDSEENV